MKVAMLTYSTGARGGVAHALKLSEHLLELGVDVTIHTLSRNDPQRVDGFYRKTEVPFEIHGYGWEDDVMARLGNMIDAYVEGLPRDADIYHTQDCVGGTALHRLHEGGALAAPIFRTLHHIDDFAEPRLYEFEKRAIRHADHRFVVSEYWRRALKEEYGLDSVIAHNGIDLDDFEDLPARQSKAPTILFVGGLEPRKGLEILILSLPEVRAVHPNAVLRVVAKTGFRGVDSVEWFEHLADRARVDDAVTFHESIGQEELRQLYSDADIVVLPSRNEGWGLSLMEAMACRRPVIATKVGGIPELVRDGIDGILIEPDDTKALGGAITELLGNPALRARMGASGRERARAFSWEETARVTVREYERALKKDSQRTRP